MTILEKSEIRQLPEKEWQGEIQKAQRERMKVDYDHQNGHSKASHLLRKGRKYIAQLKTIKKEQEMAAAKKSRKA